MSRFAANYPTSILQRINENHQFDGSLSLGAETTTRGGAMYEYAIADAGGLFYWDNQEPMVIDQINVNLGAAGDCSIWIVNLDENLAEIAAETFRIYNVSGQQHIALDHAQMQLTLLPRQAIKIISATSAAAKVAQVVGSSERAYVR